VTARLRRWTGGIAMALAADFKSYALPHSSLLVPSTEDIVIPSSNALTLVNATPGAWLARFKEGGHAFMAQYPTAAGGSHQRVPRPLIERRLSQSQDAIQDAYRVHAFQRLRIGFA